MDKAECYRPNYNNDRPERSLTPCLLLYGLEFETRLSCPNNCAVRRAVRAV